MIELRIDGVAVDIAPNTQITLDFNSNAFGDISKIVSNKSFTIQLPKTPHNRKIFGDPGVLGGASNAPYKRWNAELYVNGVSVIDIAFAVLLSVGASYEVVLYWGVISALETLKNSDKTLRDINEVLDIQYGGKEWWKNWEGQIGSSPEGEADGIVNAVYNPGIGDLRNDVIASANYALLPSVTASWVWDSIVTDNNLDIVGDDGLRGVLKNVALPFTTHKVTEAVDTRVDFTKVTYKEYYRGTTLGRIATFHTPATTPAETSAGRFSKGTIKTKFGGRTKEFVTYFYEAKMEHEAEFSLDTNIKSSAFPMSMVSLGFQVIKKDDSIKEEAETKPKSNRVAEFSWKTDLDVGDRVIAYVFIHDVVTTLATANLRVKVEEDARDQTFGGLINTRDNLPDIKQMDFLKAMCAMYGMWATLVDGKIHLVDYADFYNGKFPTLDWSQKLVDSGNGDANKTTFTLSSFAQRNILNYKEDDTVKVDASSVLLVENENLGEENDMVELPFAASDGDVIPHLVKNEEGKIEEEDVEPRIMTLRSYIGKDGPHTELTFEGLSFNELVNKYYTDWQRVMRKPIVIEEKFHLNEIDIKQLDFRKPIYLQKYGARFVVEKVQWREGEPSTVALIYLPPMEEIGVAMPYTIKTGVTIGSSFGGDNDSNPYYEEFVSGAGEYFADNATLYFDEATAKAKYDLSFRYWESEIGTILSTENPFVYDGSNGDMTIYANVLEPIILPN